MSPLAKLWMMDLLETAYIVDPDYNHESYMEEVLSEKLTKELNKSILSPAASEFDEYLENLKQGKTH